jgi:hypothetical protein
MAIWPPGGRTSPRNAVADIQQVDGAHQDDAGCGAAGARIRGTRCVVVEATMRACKPSAALRLQLR